VRLFKLVAQLSKPNVFTRPANLEESQREFGFSAFPDFISDLFAGCLRRFKTPLFLNGVRHSPEAVFITGQTVFVDGGASLANSLTRGIGGKTFRI
jgi:hypothetical protein